MTRRDGRKPEDLRPVRITRNYLKHAEGAVLVEVGETRVICTASVEDRVPPFLRGAGQGWVTAEYGMLPRATNTRTAREAGRTGGRTHEIQRLVGRSLRAVVEMAKLRARCVMTTYDPDTLEQDVSVLRRIASRFGGTMALDCGVVSGGRIAVGDPVELA